MTRRRRAATDPVGNRAFDESGILFRVLATLSEREAGVIAMRFGLTKAREPLTLSEIGKIYGVSRERIHQIEEKVLLKLRHPSRSKLLKAYDHDGKEFDYIDVAGKPRPTALDRSIFERWRANLISCAHCGKQDFATRGNGGRPRRYCTNKCRQAAYRARRASADP